MYLEVQQKIRERFVQAVEEVFGLKVAEPVLGYPPSVELGELSITSCFELAKQLRQAPRKIAEQVAPRLVPLEGVERVSIAGAGYLNIYLDRAKLAASVFELRASEAPDLRRTSAGAVREAPPLLASSDGKILVEHTSINPNKAAHIGHLRNAVLGDTFVRLLRFRGRQVEVQNYIDNTGVQVADVVVGFVHLEKKGVKDVRKLIADPAVRFDFYCWDLYARVFQHYDTNPDAPGWRAEALKAIEEGYGEIAEIAELVSGDIVRKHLETMRRVNVQYDLLVQESEILRLHFWNHAFELLKSNGALRYEESGKNRGCWVMSLAEASPGPDATSAAEIGNDLESQEDVKIIVRSNGTVTYVGKDVAYHLWKFGLLGMDFGYEIFYRYPDGHPVWRTSDRTAGRGAEVPTSVALGLGTAAGAKSNSSVEPSLTPNPESGTSFFGHASAAYAVIDTRQSYVQKVVAAAFRALGYREQAANLHHFAYEVVGLSPRCAEEMGVQIDEAEREKPYIEVSGRKGMGIKADDLIDRLVEKASQEVGARQMTESPDEQAIYSRMIAVSALRYFLLKYTRRAIIAFDFKEALAFEGETGPYLQYSVVRARNIFRKFRENHPDFSIDRLATALSLEGLASFLAARPGLAGASGNEFWELVLLAAQLELTADQAIAAEEPALLAKYAFRLAQTFNNFYHRHRILSESDEARQNFLLFLLFLVNETLSRTLDLLGIEIPERM